MKNLLFIVPLLLLGFKSKAQYYTLYYNLEMHQQVTANHAVRMASEKNYQRIYEKQKEAYNEAKEKITEVVVIKNNLYGYLRNVNSALRQGKQVQFLFQDFNKLVGNMGTMIDLTADKPQYAPLITRMYERIFTHALQAYDGVHDQILREDTDYLMDSYDRQYLLNKLHREIKSLNGWVLHINNYLRNAHRKPYLRHIRVFNEWYSKDKTMIESIIRNSTTLSDF